MSAETELEENVDVGVVIDRWVALLAIVNGARKSAVQRVVLATDEQDLKIGGRPMRADRRQSTRLTRWLSSTVCVVIALSNYFSNILLNSW